MRFGLDFNASLNALPNQGAEKNFTLNGIGGWMFRFVSNYAISEFLQVLHFGYDASDERKILGRVGRNGEIVCRVAVHVGLRVADIRSSVPMLTGFGPIVTLLLSKSKRPSLKSALMSNPTSSQLMMSLVWVTPASSVYSIEMRSLEMCGFILGYLLK